jgi:predicted phosphodiesterase
MRKAELTVVFSDVHHPVNDKRLWAQALQWLARHKKVIRRVVLLGDFMDVEALSEHGGNPQPPSLLEEVRPTKRALQQLRATLPDTDIEYLAGNHEYRFDRWVANHAKQLHGCVSLTELLGLKELGIRWHEYGKVFKVGKLNLVHGFWGGDHHAKKHLMEFGSSLLYGHLHRPQVYTRGLVDGTVHGAFAMPTMAQLQAQYLHNKPSGWMLGFGLVWSLPNGLFNVHMVLSNHGQWPDPLTGDIYGSR